MKRILSLLLAILMMGGAFAACGTPAEPVDSTDDTTADTTPAETTEPAKTEPDYTDYQIAGMSAFEADCGDFILQFEAPSVAYYGKEEDTAWGQHTFPGLTRTTDGLIRLGWQYGEDRVGATAVGFSKASANGGKSWVPAASTTAMPKWKMADGTYFMGFASAGTTTMFSTSKYTPDVTWGSNKRFMAEDFIGDEQAEKYKVISLQSRIYDPETKENTTIDSVLNWPWAGVHVYPGNITYTLSGVFGLSGGNVISTADGTLYTCIYCGGFDSDAETREEAIANISDPSKSNIYVFESTDNARTWNYVSQILSTEERRARSVAVEGTSSGDEGYTEPKMIEMPDGSFFMLLRTGSSRTLFYSVSTDNCRTWSEPAAFDECGVLPQLLRLENGMTIASYGRPTLYVRATNDPTGQEWADHVEIPLCNDMALSKYMQKGCFYTGLLALDEDSFLICFTDFNYPNKDGVPVHTVLTRRVHVVMKDAEK